MYLTRKLSNQSVKMKSLSEGNKLVNPPLPTELIKRDKKVKILVHYYLIKSTFECISEPKSAIGNQDHITAVLYMYFQGI